VGPRGRPKKDKSHGRVDTKNEARGEILMSVDEETLKRTNDEMFKEVTLGRTSPWHQDMDEHMFWM
jgi:hypothetical protein